MNAISAMMAGQNRAPNTIKLRNLYTDYASQSMERGEQPMAFEDWAKANYPDHKILK